MKKPLEALLALMILSPLIMGNVYAWDPTTSDLTGTNSSTNSSVSGANRRFDIDGSSSPTVYGMQKGDDSDSLAHLMKMGTIQTSSGSPITVGTSTVSNATLFDYERKSFYANGRYWVFYVDGTNMVYSTSTDGTSWTVGPQSPIRGGDWGGGNFFSIYFDGTYVHYVFGYYNVLNYPLLYRRGTPNSDGTITWSKAE